MKNHYLPHLRTLFTITLGLFLVLNMLKSAMAVPAYPHPIKYEQADGTTLTIVIRGDESLHWQETIDGYTLLRNNKGIFEYAAKNKKNDLVVSGIKAQDPEKRSNVEKKFLKGIQKSLQYSGSQTSIMRQLKQVYDKEAMQEKVFPTTGSRKLVCILIGFTDLAFTKTQTEFNDLFNQINYSVDGAQGSVKDFYLENSYNQFNLTVTVAGPYTASNNMAYYGGNNSSGDDVNPRALAAEAVTLADGDVNYANFDNDNDGSVDGVYIIFAGYGEEAGASEDAIWSHAWNLSPTLTKDGKNISKYSCSPELRSYTGTGITRIGVICHEFGHVLGSPDYYDTNYGTDGQYQGTGSWDLMANGSWNGESGSCPAHHNIYTKWHYYNWVTPTLLSSSGTYSLNNIEYNKQAYYFTSNTSGEFFLMENRQQTGFDTSIPGHGLIIYHVDQNGIDLSSYTINATHPQYMYPVCASATVNPSGSASSYGSINSAGCPFPGSGNETEFTDGSLPGAIIWDKSFCNKPMTEISETSGVISFSFMDTKLPSNFQATTISGSEIDLTWALNSNNNPVLIAYSTTPTFGTPVNGTTYTAGNVIPGGGTVIYYGTNTSFNHLNLEEGTSYYYRAWSNNSGTYSAGLPQHASTPLDIVENFPWTEDFENEGNIPNGWTQRQIKSSGVDWSFVTGNGGSHPSTAHNGTYNACLKDQSSGSNETRLISPAFDLGNRSDVTLTFWHTQEDWSGDQDELTVFYRTSSSSGWIQLAQYTNSISAWTQETLSLPDVTSDYYICFQGNAAYGYGVCIDDVTIDCTAAVPTTYTLSNESINNEESNCFNATDTIYVAGDGTSVDFNDGSTVNLIAGKSIRFLPGFYAHNGSYMYAWITTDSSFCSSLPSIVEAPIESTKEMVSVEDELKLQGAVDKMIKIYPNPSNGRFIVELSNFEERSVITVSNILGAVVHRSYLESNVKPIELTNISSGLYFVSVTNGTTTVTKKIIIQ